MISCWKMISVVILESIHKEIIDMTTIFEDMTDYKFVYSQLSWLIIYTNL